MRNRYLRVKPLDLGGTTVSPLKISVICASFHSLANTSRRHPEMWVKAITPRPRTVEYNLSSFRRSACTVSCTNCLARTLTACTDSVTNERVSFSAHLWPMRAEFYRTIRWSDCTQTFSTDFWSLSSPRPRVPLASSIWSLSCGSPLLICRIPSILQAVHWMQ